MVKKTQKRRFRKLKGGFWNSVKNSADKVKTELSSWYRDARNESLSMKANRNRGGYRKRVKPVSWS